MVWYITVHTTSFFEMHSNSQKDNRNTFKIVVLILLFSAFVVYGLLTDIVSDAFWPFPTVGIGVALLVILLISISRRRVKQSKVQQFADKTYEQYHTIEEKTLEYKVSKSQNFCEFCGTKLKEYEDFCINCGKKRDY